MGGAGVPGPTPVPPAYGTYMHSRSHNFRGFGALAHPLLGAGQHGALPRALLGGVDAAADPLGRLPCLGGLTCLGFEQP